MLSPSTKNIFATPRKFFHKNIAPLLVLTGFVLAPANAPAAIQTFNFSNTTLAASVGPDNPASGPAAIYGTNLNSGDVIVFDGAVIDNSPSASGDWGSIDFNGSGVGGLTGATLGVLVRDGTAASDLCSVWASGSSVNLGFNPTPATNRCRVEITCTQSGTTTNLNYVVYLDQGFTGTFNITNSGNGLTFPNNVIPLQFGTRNVSQTFIQVTPIIALSPLTPATNTAIAGNPTTFTANLIQGYPLNKIAAQWLSNGVPVLGATNLIYTTPPISASYNGAHYSVIVTNLATGGNVITSSVSILNVRTTPGIVTFNFPTTTVADGGYYGPITDPHSSISGSSLLLGDTVVFDGIVIPNGSQQPDAWTALSIDGGGYGDVEGAVLGVLDRQGSAPNPSQIFINASGGPNPTSGSSATNRVRIELYPSATGSTTNMGWLVEIDQNLTGTFLPAITGTNLTFPGNTLPLTFGSSGDSAFVYQNPESPVSIFTQPTPFQIVATGAPITVGVRVLGWYPSFQWRKNGVPIGSATNETFTVPAATLADNGDQFTVVVRNRLNPLNVVTSAVANVSVLIPNNLSWDPNSDYTTWDTATTNWTADGGLDYTNFSSGDNVTFDSLGYNIGGAYITLTNTVSPNAVTVNATSSEIYQLAGTGKVSGQSLYLTGDDTGILDLQASASFAHVLIDPGLTLDIGANGTDDPAFDAGTITNNGYIYFQNAAGSLTISGAITGSGSLTQNGAGATVLTSTNSAYSIAVINAGSLSIASTPNPGDIQNNAELQLNSSASVLSIPNAMTGSGYYFVSGFQTTILTGSSSHTGQNILYWSDTIVDNPAALGDPNYGYTSVSGGDRYGGLYLSNNITWTQPLQLNTRYSTGVAATAPHISNYNGTNTISSPLVFNTDVSAAVVGTEINVEATTGQLLIDATSSLANNSTYDPIDLNLQGPATGIWNGALLDGGTPLNIFKRGPGTWTLGGANSYTGNTTVSQGTLLITNQISSPGNVSVQSGAILGGNGALIAGPVSVATGATLAPGLPSGNGAGILTINNNLTLSPGSFTSVQVNKTAATSDIITGLNTLTYDGTLVVSNLSGAFANGDAFPLFSATSYTGSFAAILPAHPGNGLSWDTRTLAADGTLRVTSGNTIAGNSTNLTAKVVGGNTLQLTWPADHTGWILEAQTNALGAGLGANWVRLGASATTNQISVPIVTTNGSVFYRLINQ